MVSMKKILLIMLTFSTQVSADTIINDAYYSNKTINWNKAGSPYIITGPLTFSSSTLNISDAKVIIKNGTIGLFNNSHLIMNDVSIENVHDDHTISSFNSKITANNVNLNVNEFIEAYNSYLNIGGLTSVNAGTRDLISLYTNSNMSLSNSRIENHKATVFSLRSSGIVSLKNNEFINNETAIRLYSGASTSVQYNDFEHNGVAIESYDVGNFEHNYFKKENPTVHPFKDDAPLGEKDITAGPFTIQEFSKTKNIKKQELCCSNIMFLPGVMGSRLYTAENQLWEPNRNTDVKKLYLDELGKSIGNIFTKEIIAKTNILGGLPKVDKDIYKDFIEYLNKLKSKNTITDYNAIPYDWRMSADFILSQGIKLKDKNIDLVQVVKDLQKTSKTGKVTIITHSNGGLVAKQLLLELERLGLEKNVDKIIFVAMPEYGTAQAITALMFGHNQSLAGGLIMRSSIARELGKNMPTAYTLLPSEKYYTFNPNADKLLQETVIRNYSRVNPGLLQKSKDLHQQLDNMIYPDNIAIHQILGTGVLTLSDIQIDDKNLYKLVPLYDRAGDGVVQDLYSSRKENVLFVNLAGTIYKHVDIMNSSEVINRINTIVQPPRYDIPPVGLDYNKIIKDNTYKLLRITQSPKNKISEYLSPLDMELSMGMSKLNDNIDNELYFDRYSANTVNYFREALEHLNNNRFEEFDDGINYLYTDTMDKFSITSKTNNTIDISILESIDGEISESEYKNINIFKNSKISFEPDENNSLNITLPHTGQIMRIEEERLKTELSLNEKIDKAISDIRSSKMEHYIKDRYIRRIELYRQNKDIKYLETIKNRVTNAIDSMNKISHSLALKARYGKLKEDYIYLNFLLLKL